MNIFHSNFIVKFFLHPLDSKFFSFAMHFLLLLCLHLFSLRFQIVHCSETKEFFFIIFWITTQLGILVSTCPCPWLNEGLVPRDTNHPGRGQSFRYGYFLPKPVKVTLLCVGVSYSLPIMQHCDSQYDGLVRCF